MNKPILALTSAAAAASLLAAGWAIAQSADHSAEAQAAVAPQPPMGPGRMGMGRGGMMGMGGGSATAEERQDIHTLLMNPQSIRRTVTNLPNGIRTLTESNDPEIARAISQHVVDMGERLKAGKDLAMPMESPALRSLFPAHSAITSTYAPTALGYSVTQTSSDPVVVKALQEHAAEVSDLAARGMVAAQEAMMKNSGGMMGRRAGAAAPTEAPHVH